MKLFRLLSELARKHALKAVQEAPEGWVVEISEPTRTSPQNALLHATLTDISKQKQWAGERLDVEDWKRLMTAAWLRAIGQSVKIVPAIDGNGFDVLYRRTSKMKVSEVSSLTEYVTAWAVDNGVKLSAPDRDAA